MKWEWRIKKLQIYCPYCSNNLGHDKLGINGRYSCNDESCKKKLMEHFRKLQNDHP